MQIVLEINVGAGNSELTTNPWVIIQWERRTGKTYAALEDASLEDWCYLAWEASKVAGHQVPATFDEFLATLQHIHVVGAKQVNPTQPVASEG